jgi:hypothetical protein
MSVMSFDHFVLNVEEDDVSTAGSVYVVAPSDGKIEKVYSVIDGTIATAAAVATVKINGTAVTGGTITVANSGSAAGDVDSCTPSGANKFVAGNYIQIANAGASTNTIQANYTILCKLSTN